MPKKSKVVKFLKSLFVIARTHFDQMAKIMRTDSGTKLCV